MAFRRTKMLIQLRSSVVHGHGVFFRYTLRYLLHQYSTESPSVEARRTNSLLLADYMVKSLGFPREHAESASEKVTVSFESLERAQMVVDFLKETGFDETHIRKMVNLCPRILFCGVEKTLKPKIEAFRSLGFSGSQIGTIFSTNPFVTIRGLNSHIVPTISVLHSVFASNDKLFKAMKKTPWMLSDAVRRNFPKNVALLQSYGISRESIEKMTLRRPQKLLQNPEWFENVPKRVEKKLGISRDSKRFVYGLEAIAMVSEAKIDAKLEIFRSFGWTESNISLMIKASPCVLKISEGKIMKKLELLMGELGFDPKYLATRSLLLSLSLEKRMLPRIALFRVLKEKCLFKREPAFLTFMKLKEDKFLEMFVIPFKDEVPCLYEDYCNSVGVAAKISHLADVDETQHGDN